MTIRVIDGDVMAVLPTLDAESAQTCVTSPPYWGAQRDYGMTQQIGHERTPEEYVARLVIVFREVRRVLRDDGTLFLNVGDSYAASGKGGGGTAMQKRGEAWGHRERMRGWRSAPPGYKNKDLVGVPWMLAFALRADGWYLRRDIVWAKSVPTEPTRADRPVAQHEMVFLFSLSPRYKYELPPAQEGSVWRISSSGTHGLHTATMPPELAERCIARGSNRGDTVLDPFGGAGTTGLVADRLGRDAVLVELNPTYAAMARDRIASDAPLFHDSEPAA